MENEQTKNYYIITFCVKDSPLTLIGQEPESQYLEAIFGNQYYSNGDINKAYLFDMIQDARFWADQLKIENAKILKVQRITTITEDD